MAGREGFEPSVELLAPQPLSRRPQSSTLAPPRGMAGRRSDAAPSRHCVGRRITTRRRLSAPSALPATDPSGGGRGIRTPGDLAASAVFKTAAIVHSAIPPRHRSMAPPLGPATRAARRMVSGATFPPLRHVEYSREPPECQLQCSRSLRVCNLVPHGLQSGHNHV